MRWNQCRLTRQEIDETGFGEQPSEPALAHVAVCAGCREFRDQRVLLRELTASLPVVAAPADFDIKLRARLASSSAQRRSSILSFSELRFGSPVLAFAATILVLVGAVVVLNQVGFIRSRPTPSTHVAEVHPANVNPASTPVVIENGHEVKTTIPVTPPVVPTIAKGIHHGEKAIFAKNSPSALSKTSGDQSSDSSIKPAWSLKQTEPFITPATALQVSLQDGRGGMHTISLPPVSFGAQLGQPKSGTQAAAANRVW